MHVMAVRAERALLRHRNFEVVVVGDARLRTLNQDATRNQYGHGSGHGELPERVFAPLRIIDLGSPDAIVPCSIVPELAATQQKTPHLGSAACTSD